MRADSSCAERGTTHDSDRGKAMRALIGVTEVVVLLMLVGLVLVAAAGVGPGLSLA